MIINFSSSQKRLFCLFLQLKNIQESIEFINSRPKPLAIYAFTKDEEFRQRILSETSSGSVIFNDVLIQVLHLFFSKCFPFSYLLFKTIKGCQNPNYTTHVSIYSFSVMLYPLVVLVRVALAGTMGSILSILSAMRKQSCEETSSLNLSLDILHGMTLKWNLSDWPTMLTTWVYFCFYWDLKGRICIESSKWSTEYSYGPIPTSLFRQVDLEQPFLFYLSSACKFYSLFSEICSLILYLLRSNRLTGVSQKQCNTWKHTNNAIMETKSISEHREKIKTWAKELNKLCTKEIDKAILFQKFINTIRKVPLTSMAISSISIFLQLIFWIFPSLEIGLHLFRMNLTFSHGVALNDALQIYHASVNDVL